MPWWVVLPAALAVTRAVLIHLNESKPIKGLPSSPPLEVRGAVNGSKIVVLGRTGAGKSSLINAIKGRSILPVGDIGSTTRWLEGVEVEISQRRVLLVDSPGVGEAQTHDTYLREITAWCRLCRDSVKGFVVVLQADAKGHSEDKTLLEALVKEVPHAGILIVISQSDKMKPAREPFASDSWAIELQTGSQKSINIREKIDVVAQQFGVPVSAVLPVALEQPAFNLESLRVSLLSLIFDVSADAPLRGSPALVRRPSSSASHR